jgi:predicted acylesterase/phospholipase RssA
LLLIFVLKAQGVWGFSSPGNVAVQYHCNAARHPDDVPAVAYSPAMPQNALAYWGHVFGEIVLQVLRRIVQLLALAIVFSLCGCATFLEHNGIANARLASQATIDGMPAVRFWQDEAPRDVIAEVHRRLPNLPRLAQNSQLIGGRPVVDTLALSGGGSDGAFGAGVLTGWTERGDRPEFEIVTGVSAGAIIAPFAFLGSKYNPQLKEIWTHYETSEIVTASILPGLLGGPALADNAPLQALMAQYIDKKLLRAIAQEYAKGRLLFVLTTNLDAQRPVVWNMGEIARQGSEEALVLFRKVILASAAIPGALPPVSIPVVAGGKSYDELHVDGGTTREVFVLPVQAPFKAFDPLYSAPPIRRLHIIKNGKLTPEPEVTKPKAVSIAARAIATLIKSQNLTELYRIYRLAQDADAEFNLLAVPPTFTMKAKEFFDPEYQAALFEEGRKVGRAGGPWLHKPTPAADVAHGR